MLIHVNISPHLIAGFQFWDGSICVVFGLAFSPALALDLATIVFLAIVIATIAFIGLGVVPCTFAAFAFFKRSHFN